jgi:hypothetical protein
VKRRRTIIHARVGLVRIQQKVYWDTLRRTCVFATSGICESRSAFHCFWGTKHQRTIFKLGWDRIRFKKKRRGTRYAELVFLHPMGFAGHVVHSDASRAQKVDTIFHARVGPMHFP